MTPSDFTYSNNWQEFKQMAEPEIPLEVYKKVEEMVRIGRSAVHKAQEESRRLGVPNVYSFNGILHYEWPNGELSTQDPWQGKRTNPNLPKTETE